MKLKELIHDYYINSNAAQSSDVIANEIVNVVKEWLKNYHKEDNNKYDFDYFSGWADCIDILERDLRQDTSQTVTRALHRCPLLLYNDLMNTKFL